MKMIVVSERQDPRSDQELICCDPSATSRTDNFIHYSMILFTMMMMLTMMMMMTMTMTMMQEEVLVVARKWWKSCFWISGSFLSGSFLLWWEHRHIWWAMMAQPWSLVHLVQMVHWKTIEHGTSGGRRGVYHSFRWQEILACHCIKLLSSPWELLTPDATVNVNRVSSAYHWWGLSTSCVWWALYLTLPCHSKHFSNILDWRIQL